MTWEDSIKGKGFWKLNNSHLTNPQYIEQINTVIDYANVRYESLDPGQYWEMLKMDIRESSVYFSRNAAHETKIRNALLHKRLNAAHKKLAMINVTAQNAMTLIQKVNDKIDMLKQELNEMGSVKVRGSIIRSKVRWAEEGEKMSSYFFSLEKKNYKSKTMAKIELSSGETTRCPKTILNEQKSFYEKLYTKDCSVSFKLDTKFKKGISQLEKLELEKELTIDELSLALKSMPNNKTPGNDGLSADFMKVFWGRLKQNFFEAVIYAQKCGLLHITARQGVITLIPKGNRNRTQLANWRPIILLNVCYKILAKAMANRLKQTLTSFISIDQTGFLSGRDISENLRKVFDIIDYTLAKDIPAMIVSVDCQKAFDRVDYQAMFKILEYFNYDPVFINWMKLLFNEFSLCTINNGNSSSYFSPTRGLFQGNPIASYLFLTIIEILSMLLKNDEKVEGLTIKEQRVLLSQFADDLDLFLKFKERTWHAVIRNFDIFERITGMKISYEKTTIYRIGAARNSQATFYSTRKIKWTDKPLNILGVMVTHETDNVIQLNYEELVVKSKNIIKVWKMRDLTLIGKILILNTLVASLFYYRMAVLPSITDNLISQMKQMFVDFIWSGRKPKIKYDIISGLKQDRGLGLVNLQKRDVSLKMQWPFKKQKNPILKTLAYELIGNEIGDLIWECQIHESDIDKVFKHKMQSKFWNDVLKYWARMNYEKPISKDQIRNQVVWFNSSIQKEHLPYLDKGIYQLGITRIEHLMKNNRLMSIEEFITEYSAKSKMLGFLSLVTAIPQEWKRTLLSENASSNKYEPKIMVWAAHKSVVQIAYVKLHRNELLLSDLAARWSITFANKIEVNELLNIVQRIYTITNIPKLRSLQYRILTKGLITNLQLKIYKIKEMNLCTFCSQYTETIVHLFCDCIHVRPLWSYIENLSFNHTLESSQIIFNNPVRNAKLVENVLILLTKFYIYRTRCQNERLSVQQLKNFIQEYKNVEYQIAIKNGRLSHHEIKWT